jgi:hypothetical protein
VVIGREDAHHGVRIRIVQDFCRKPDRRRSVALGGLGENLALRHAGQLPRDLLAQMLIGQNPDSLAGNQLFQPRYGLLDECVFSKEPEHLLGALRSAARPEPSPSPACEDERVKVVLLH